MLGLLVDWGYRSDGVPVKLFGQWTALPAGPATLAAKTGSRILPVSIRRRPDGTFLVTWPGPIDLASDDPAELQRATQAIADALATTIAAAPDQWYSFKPIWPAAAAEAADLERRATLMQAGIADPGPAPEFA
jgi:KDO2-lipid IV(A) lauroyltransferase